MNQIALLLGEDCFKKVKIEAAYSRNGKEVGRKGIFARS